MRIFLFVPLLCVGLPWIGPVRADDCPPLTILTSVQMQIGVDNRPYVPVKIEGKSKSMVIDTGGYFTEISQPVVDELDLPSRHTRLQLIGVYGDKTQTAATASLVLGNLRANNMDFMVMPSVHQFATDIKDAAGLIAPNFLRPYDADFDFAKGKFNLLSHKHCEGKVVYWPNNAVAVVPIDVNRDGHVIVPVDLDGEKLRAVLDTGASVSILNMRVAIGAFGLKPGATDTPLSSDRLGQSDVQSYTHRFKSLSLEGVTIFNPTLRIIPDLVRSKVIDPHDALEGDTRVKSTTSQVGMDEVILGMDVLRRLHLYIAYKEERLYITPATPEAVATPATDTAAPPAGSESK
jgi:predicted aspartyl protease